MEAICYYAYEASCDLRRTGAIPPSRLQEGPRPPPPDTLELWKKSAAYRQCPTRRTLDWKLLREKIKKMGWDSNVVAIAPTAIATSWAPALH
jgi:ribonucleotide reductase alpha subunit